MLHLRFGFTAMFKSKFITGVVSFVLVMIMSIAAFADTIKLKDGSIIKGRIINFTNGKFTILVGEGSRQKRLVYSATEIDSIKFDEPRSAPQLATKPPATKPQPTTTATQPATPQTIPVVSKPTATTPAAPITWSIRVMGDNTANGWTNTGWVVQKGQRIRISATGQISLGGGKMSPPAGLTDLVDENKLIRNMPTGGLVAVIGDDNNDFIFIGANREIVATRDGALFLGVNEGNINDNSGAFNAKVEIFPI